MTRLFVFDMDGTLLPNTTGMLEIAKITGHLPELELLEKQYFERLITNEQFAKGLYDLWKEIAPETIKLAFDQSPKMQNIERALLTIRERGGISCLITSSPYFFASHFSDYGFDHIYASKPFDLIERLFTPEHVLYGKDKPILTEKLCQKLQLKLEDTIAFGDSISDVPLFQKLQHTVAVNADFHLKDHAKHHYKGSDLLEALSLVPF